MTNINLIGKMIRCKSMPGEPYPVPPGTKGLVLEVTEHKSMGFIQIRVAWENHMTLMLAIPPDEYEVLP